MEPKNTNTELIPRSIFKGKNSDGTSFTANEWAPDSIGNLPTGGGITTFGLIILFMVLISPITLLMSLSSSNKFINLLGAVVGSYFLIDCYNHWLVFTMTMVLMTNEIMVFFLMLNIASVITNISLLVLKSLTNSNAVIVVIGIIIFTLSINNYDSKYLSEYNLFKYQTDMPESVYDPKPEDNRTLDGSEMKPF
jgi:hypothetical protein